MKIILVLIAACLFLAACSNQSDSQITYITTADANTTATDTTAANTAISTDPAISEDTIPATVSQTAEYPWHNDIWTTEFWVGEEPSADNNYISNVPSAWDEQWVAHFGGYDDPKCRKGYFPCDFVPTENPFYCALPYGDFDYEGKKSNLDVIYWFKPEDQQDNDLSLLKNRWIEVSSNDKSCYCQWEDVGPGYSDDYNYVFGSARPMNENDGDDHKSGLDVSPAMNLCLGIDGLGLADWRFVEVEQVPPGPWTEIVTTSGTSWE